MANSSQYYRYRVTFAFALMVLITAVVMGYPPIQPLLESGHIVSEYNWLLVFFEELLIAVTEYVMYSGGLALFWGAIGVAVGYDRLFFKMIELYWIQLLAFVLFALVVYLKMGALKYLVVLVMNFVPLFQSIFLYNSLFRDSTRDKVASVVFVLTSFVLLVVLQRLHMTVYEGFVEAYR